LKFIIPAYNEEGRIGATLSALASSFPEAGVIVVFDGDDGTPDVVRRFGGVELHRYLKRLGKGGALREGLALLRGGEVGVLLDADLPVSADQIREAIKAFDGHDLLIARRVYAVKPKGRYLPHLAFNALSKLFFPALVPFDDWQGGFKVFRAEAAKEVLGELVLNDFIIDTNLLYAFLRRGKRVLEYPVTWRHEDEGSKVSGKVMKVALMDFLSLVKLRVYYSPLRPILSTRSFSRAQALAIRALRRDFLPGARVGLPRGSVPWPQLGRPERRGNEKEIENKKG